MKLALVAILGAAVTAGALAGCSSSSGGSGQASGGTAAPGATAGYPLAITVTAPTPASWLTTGAVTLVGRAVAPSGLPVASVVVASVPATVQSDGTFQVALQLPSGIARVLLVATDTGGTTFATTVSYMVGPFAPRQWVPGAALVQINPAGLPALERDIGTELDTIDTGALLQTLNPLPVKVLGGVVVVWVEFVSAVHAPSQVQLGLGTNALDLNLVLPGAAVSVIVHDATSSILPVSIPAVLTANSIQGSVAATFSNPASSSGSAQAALGPSTVSVSGLSIQTSGTLGQVLAALLLSTVQSALETAVEGVIANDVPPIIGRTLAGTGKPYALNVGAATVDLALRAQEIDVSPAGLALTVAAVVSPALGTAAEYPTVTTSAPALSTAMDVSVAVATDFLSETLVALQAGGALDLDVDASSWPASLGPLDLQTIGALVPELASAGPGSTPVVLQVRPALPPLLAVGPGAEPFTLSLGEARIEILADTGGGVLVPLLGVAAHTSLPVALSVQGSTLAVTAGATPPQVDWSVVDQPFAPVDETRLQVRLAVLFDALLPQLLARVSSIPLPSGVTGIISTGDVGASGTGLDNLTVSADLR